VPVLRRRERVGERGRRAWSGVLWRRGRRGDLGLRASWQHAHERPTMARSHPMTESVPTPSGGADVTTAEFLARVPEARLLRMRVVGIDEIGTTTRAVRLASDDLAGFRYAPGQDLMLLVATS